MHVTPVCELLCQQSLHVMHSGYKTASCHLFTACVDVEYITPAPVVKTRLTWRRWTVRDLCLTVLLFNVGIIEEMQSKGYAGETSEKSGYGVCQERGGAGKLHLLEHQLKNAGPHQHALGCDTCLAGRIVMSRGADEEALSIVVLTRKVTSVTLGKEAQQETTGTQ